MRGFNVALGMMMNTPFATLNSESLSVIPLFTLMGVVCAYAGISQDLYAACYKLVSRLRGGLAIATEIACAFFAAICGSSTATTASMGKICLPEMDKFNYKRTLTCGSISAGGTLGILIPPSVGFMLYGINAGVGVGKMFIAGIIPGILLCMCYSSVVLVICAIDPAAGPKGPKFSTREKLKAGLGVLPVLVLFALVRGGILHGWCSASEGAAVGAAGAFVFMVLKRKFTLKNLLGSLVETAETTAMIFLIMIGANILGGFLNMTGLPQVIATAAANAEIAPIWILLACLMIYAILGCFVDSLPLIVLLTPIFLPIVRNLEFSFGGFGANSDGVTVWFGVLMVMLMEILLLLEQLQLLVLVELLSGQKMETKKSKMVYTLPM
jgi:tripartite ATP-independent transporter DctM subunit